MVAHAGFSNVRSCTPFIAITYEKVKVNTDVKDLSLGQVPVKYYLKYTNV